MALKYSDYLFTPNDIFRGVLYAIKSLRPFDVVGEAVIFLILISTKQLLGWEIGSGLVLVLLFAILYWKPYSIITSRRGVLYTGKNISSDDIMNILILTIFFLFTKDYMFWQVDSILLLLFFFSIFYRNIDSRIPIGLALICLTACPILLIMSNNYNFLEGEDWAEQVAVWTYYLLVFGVAKQVWDFWKEGQEELHRERKSLSAQK